MLPILLGTVLCCSVCKYNRIHIYFVAITVPTRGTCTRLPSQRAAQAEGTSDSTLTEQSPSNWYQPVYYANQRLSVAERNYSTMEREALDMIYNIAKFQLYFLDRKFTFHVDYSALLYLVTKQSLTGRLARWMCRDLVPSIDEKD